MLRRSEIKSNPTIKDSELSDLMYQRVKSIRKKYEISPTEIDKNEVRLDALSYAIAIGNVNNEAGQQQRALEVISVVTEAVQGDFRGLKNWLEYHARPDTVNKIQSEINLANLL